MVKTVSVTIQSLCVPCMNRCRYCLLSWSGTPEGLDWARSVRTAERLLGEIRAERPELRAYISYGYSMEHPDLRGAIRTLRRLGSPMADFLQCDGMRDRDEAECRELMTLLREEGIKRLNFTVYGLPEYHDRFAGRKGDYALLLRMMAAAREAGIPFSTGVPLTAENAAQADELTNALRRAGSEIVSLFIPHEEGRGRLLGPVRAAERDLRLLSPDTRRLLNRDIYRTEAEWLSAPEPVRDTERHILLSLRPETAQQTETRSAASLIREAEDLDEAYYAAFPGFSALAREYGDPRGDRLYRIRDLYHHYRRRYGEEHGVRVYDVTDERMTGSRRS